MQRDRSKRDIYQERADYEGVPRALAKARTFGDVFKTNPDPWVPRQPVVGEKIYVPTSLFLGHGRDDFEGGIATIKEIREFISNGKLTPFISIEERPGTQYNWLMLLKDQPELRAEYGNQKAHPEPDDREEFNRD